MIDIEITPNRGDCLNIRGIARDLAATGIGTLKPISAVKVPSHFASSIDVKIENTQDCSLYLGRVIRDVKNGPSPLWLQKKLKSVGFVKAFSITYRSVSSSITCCLWTAN